MEAQPNGFRNQQEANRSNSSSHGSKAVLSSQTRSQVYGFRSHDEQFVRDPTERRKELLSQADWMKHRTVGTKADTSAALESADGDDLTEAFSNIIAPGRNKQSIYGPKPTNGVTIDSTSQDVFIPYVSANQHEDAGYNVQEGGNFARDAAKAVLDMTGDDEASMAGVMMKKW